MTLPLIVIFSSYFAVWINMLQEINLKIIFIFSIMLL